MDQVTLFFFFTTFYSLPSTPWDDKHTPVAGSYLVFFPEKSSRENVFGGSWSVSLRYSKNVLNWRKSTAEILALATEEVQIPT